MDSAIRRQVLSSLKISVDAQAPVIGGDELGDAVIHRWTGRCQKFGNKIQVSAGSLQRWFNGSDNKLDGRPGRGRTPENQRAAACQGEVAALSCGTKELMLWRLACLVYIAAAPAKQAT